MADLDKYSIEELEKALEKKKSKEDFKNNLQIVPFSQERYEDFVDAINDIVQEKIKGNNKDSEYWAYEASLVFVFGNNVFDILNKLRWYYGIHIKSTFKRWYR